MSERERAETVARQAQEAQQATESVQAIVQEKEAVQAVADGKREELESYLFHEKLDRDAKFETARSRMEADIRERDAGFTQQRQAELQHVSDRLQAEGLRKMARDLSGRTAEDQLAKENLEKTIADAETRAAEERGALERKQQEQRDADAEGHRARQVAFDQRLADEAATRDRMAREYAQEQAAQQEWARDAALEQQNEQNVTPDWDRPTVPEQENIEVVQETPAVMDDFDSVMVPPSQPAADQPVSDTFNTAAIPSPDDQSRYHEVYDQYSADLESPTTQDQSQDTDQGQD